MKTTLTYYKNSNTGDLIIKQHFSEISFESPDYFYDKNKKSIDIPNLAGFVEISEKKFNRESKRMRTKGIDVDSTTVKYNGYNCRIIKITDKLAEIIDNDEKRHLADVGINLDFISKELLKISEETFKLHNEQKI